MGQHINIAITSLQQLNLNGRYTYVDYLLWQFKERVELLKGRLFPMSAPSILYQRISGNLYLSLGNHFLGHDCELFSAPIDVRLPLPSQEGLGWFYRVKDRRRCLNSTTKEC